MYYNIGVSQKFKRSNDHSEWSYKLSTKLMGAAKTA